MGTPTYTPLASLTLSASAASVTFSSISQAYRDLVLVANFNTSAGSQAVTIRFNSDTGSNYNTVNANGGVNGIFSSAASAATSIELSSSFVKSDSTSDRVINNVSIMDYSTDKHKTVLNRFDVPTGTRAGTNMASGRWASTSAITTMQVIGSVPFATGSTFALYGIAS